MQRTTSNNDSWTIFPYHIYDQADQISLLTEGALFIWAFQSWVSLFKDLQEFKVAYQ